MSEYVYRSPLNDACCVPDKEQKCPWNPKIDRKTSVHTTVNWNKPRPKVLPNALAAIGHTPMIRLNRIPQQEGLKCDVYVKCEYLNPGGSVKDRMAYRILEDAEKSGILKPGYTIVEPSSGNTGIGLSLAAAIKDAVEQSIAIQPQSGTIGTVSEDSWVENIEIDDTSNIAFKLDTGAMANVIPIKEKEYVMRALGAEVIRCPVTANSFSPDGLFGTVHRLAKEIPNSVIFDQYSNPGNPLTHYDTTAEEIYDQCDGQVDMIVMGAGTGGTVTGVGRKFKEISPQTHIVCADPYGSSFALPKSINKTDVTFWEIEGMGYEFIPSTLDQKVVDVWIKVGDENALSMARRLIKDEGLLIGASCGAMMWAAVQAAKQKNLGPGKKVVVVLPDSIRNYLTKFVCDQWMEERNLKPCVNINNHPWWNINVSALELSSLQTLSINVSYETALTTMKNLGVERLPVIDEQTGVVGVITTQIIINKLTTGTVKLSDPIVDALDRLFPRVAKTANVGLVSRILEKEPYVIILDVHGTGTSKINKLIGIVTPLDFLKFLEKNK